MYLGEFEQSIDEKGRLRLPANFRPSMASGVILTRGFERNLLLIPPSAWQEFTAKIQKQSQANSLMRAFRRRFFSGAVELVPDNRGRIEIPRSLKSFAGLNGEVIVTGLGEFVELWSPENWAEVLADFEENGGGDRWDSIGI